MDELTSRLQNLNPTEIEQYLALLKSLQQQKAQETSSSSQQKPQEVVDITPAEIPPVEPEPATSSQVEPSLAERGAEGTTGEAEVVCSVPTADQFTGLPPEDVPFAFGEFGIQTLPPAEITGSKQEGKKRHRKKGLSSSTKAAANGEPSSQPEAAEGCVVGVKSTPPNQPPPPQGLASFGFFTTAPKNLEGVKTTHKLFSGFVPDKRVVPKKLDFWTKERKGEGVSTRTQPQGAHNSEPEPDVRESTPPERQKHVVGFEEWVELYRSHVSSGAGGLTEGEQVLSGSITKRHSTIPEPYKGFNRETIYTGFFAIGYEPCQARPAYFGTHNYFQEGGVNGNELRQIGRFPLGEQMPRLSVLDYDYDSGDDWDVLDGGEDVCVSSSSESLEGGESMASSDFDFVASDDEDDGGDSESELQRKIMEARQQRLRRLRGKEKLISTHSGPFVGMLPDEHPLCMYDRFDRLRSFASDALSEILTKEMETRMGGGNSVEDIAAGVLPAHQGSTVEAALKNRRNMSEEEIVALHGLVEQNRMISTKVLVEGLRENQLCVGVPRAEIERTVKRFYERKHGSLIARDEPWPASDPRLFVKAPKKVSSKSTPDGPSAPGAAVGSTQTTLPVVVVKKDSEEENEEDEGSDGTGGDADDESSPVDVGAPKVELTAAETAEAPAAQHGATGESAALPVAAPCQSPVLADGGRVSVENEDDSRSPHGVKRLREESDTCELEAPATQPKDSGNEGTE